MGSFKELPIGAGDSSEEQKKQKKD